MPKNHFTQHDGIHCSFCGRAASDVTSMIAGPGVYICDICIQNSIDILRKSSGLHAQPKHSALFQDFKLLKPSELKRALDQYVVGQEAAKQAISVAVYNHYKRIQSESLVGHLEDVEIEKSNILLI
ncbi:MAG: ClpX C4-type zinc finger protein, partial [Bacteroidota bacterium]|nr:ATP-dependent Clp protease ATP-binding subunit ClpX [Candidatus Kapabacteria bacterium]MDW8220189.1 ClpX C4-type zinc finger protein [Bacteroidota bacterium]